MSFLGGIAQKHNRLNEKNRFRPRDNTVEVHTQSSYHALVENGTQLYVHTYTRGETHMHIYMRRTESIGIHVYV